MERLLANYQDEELLNEMVSVIKSDDLNNYISFMIKNGDEIFEDNADHKHNITRVFGQHFSNFKTFENDGFNLWIAVETKSVNIIKYLLENKKWYHTKLFLIFRQIPDKTILELFVNIDLSDLNLVDIIIFLISNNRSIDTIEYFICNFNLTETDKHNLLDRCMNLKNHQMCELLIKHNFHVDYKSQRNYIPLNIVKLLINNGYVFTVDQLERLCMTEICFNNIDAINTYIELGVDINKIINERTMHNTPKLQTYDHLVSLNIDPRQIFIALSET